MLITINDKNFRKEISKSSKLFIIEFGAQWSGACFIMEPILNQIAIQYSQKIVVGRLDIDGCESIALEYRIKKLPTYLFFRNGELVDQFAGVVSKVYFLTRIDALIN